VGPYRFRSFFCPSGPGGARGWPTRHMWSMTLVFPSLAPGSRSPFSGCPQDMRALSETVGGGGAREAGEGGKGEEGTPRVIKFNSWPQIAGISRSSRPSRVALLRERCGGRSRGCQKTRRAALPITDRLGFSVATASRPAGLLPLLLRVGRENRIDSILWTTPLSVRRRNESVEVRSTKNHVRIF